MALGGPTIAVQLLGDSRSLERAFLRSGEAATVFSGRMAKANEATRGALSGAGLRGKSSLLFGSTAFIGAAAGTAAITKSIKAASDLNEEIARSENVFGEASKSVQAWAKTTADSMGLSETAALAATGALGNLFRNVGLAPQQAAKMSEALTKLSADLSLFAHVSPDQALQALSSALAGQSRSLKRYGIIVDAAAVSQRALADSGKKSASQLTSQEKVLARFELIMSQTSRIQGFFSKNQGELAAQTAILKANLSDLEANMGTALIPLAVKATAEFNKLFDVFSGKGPTAKKFEDFFGEKGQNQLSGLQLLPKNIKDIGKQTSLPELTAEEKALNEAIKEGFGPWGKLESILAAVKVQEDKVKESSGETSLAVTTLGTDAAQSAGGIDQLTNSLAALKAAQRNVTKLDFKVLTAEADRKPIEDRIALARQQVEADKKFVDATQSGSKGRRQALQKLIADEDALDSLTSQVQQKQAAAAKKRSDAAAAATKAEAAAQQRQLDQFDLKLQKAQLTPSFADDLKVLKAELAVVDGLIAKHKNNLSLQQKQVEIQSQILGIQNQQTDALKQQRDAQKQAFEDAKNQAKQLFGSLFQQIDLAASPATFLGGSRGRKTVPGTGSSASDLLVQVTNQVQAFKELTQNIATLAKRGAPASLIQAARTGEISPEQIAALAGANASTLKKIFKQVKLADKLEAQFAKAEIKAQNVTLNTSTVQLRGVADIGKGKDGELTIHVHTHLDSKEVNQQIVRTSKRRANQRRGRVGGTR
jgi:hypothetical protein